MRILLLVRGGVGRDGRYAVTPVLLSLIRRLAQRHRVTVVALAQEPKPAEYELEGATICNLGAPWDLPGWRFVRRCLRLREVLNRQPARPDIIHAFGFGTTGSLAVLAGRWLGVPVVASLEGGELVSLPEIRYGGGRTWRGRQQVKSVVRAATAVTAGSRCALEPMLVHRPDALRIPWGTEAEPTMLGSPQRSDEPPRLLTVSSINRVKDPATLLQSVRIVAERFPGVQLDWVGVDTLGGEIHRLAAALGIADRVHFHGFHPHDRLPEFRAQARLYVQASRHESQGLAVCEAAAAGLPIVGTRVGTLAELAPDAARATPVGDPGALAEGILSVLSAPELAVRLAGNARRWAEQHTADWTAQRFEELYARLAPRPSKRRFRGAA